MRTVTVISVAGSLFEGKPLHKRIEERIKEWQSETGFEVLGVSLTSCSSPPVLTVLYAALLHNDNKKDTSQSQPSDGCFV